MKGSWKFNSGLVLVFLLSLALVACGESTPTVATTTTAAAATATAAPTTTVAATTAATSAAPIPTVTPTTAVAPTTAATTTSAPATTTAPATTVATRPGRLAFVESGNLYAFDPATKEKTQLIDSGKLGVTSAVAVSAQGEFAAVVKGQTNATSIYIINAAGTVANLFSEQPAGTSDNEPEWSPDGKQLIFTRVTDSNKDGKYDFKDKHAIWLTDMPGGANPRKLSDGQQGSWASDGKRIVFVTDGKVNNDQSFASENALKMINSEGKNEWEPINPTKIPTDWNAIGFPFDPAVEFIKSPTFVDSGKKIAFTTLGHSGIVFTINSTDGKELKLWNANYEGGYGKVRGGSGTSLLLAEGQPATGVSEVEILDAAGAQPQLTARQGTKLGGVKAGFSAVLPAWSPDGKQVVFVKSTELNKPGPVKGTLVLVTLNGKDVKETTDLTTGTFSAVAWAR